ncbi:MAG TPA: PilZ domain-containing protein [Candidatus Acidoferrum sp.]|nr:PilZ domain-containing protein [Candidatus Acidoferrum sp.]
MKADTERRGGRRISTRVPTRVRPVHGADQAQQISQTAQTRDVSANGVFLYTKSRMEKGSDVELVLILPPELTSGEKCWVCCQATIVRVEEDGTEFGVAAKINRMDILPEATV